MNLALLDPFGKQVPDRVDSTLSLPPGLHLKRSSGESGDGQSDAVTAGDGQNDDDDDGAATSTPSGVKKKSKSSDKSGNDGGLPEEYRGANHLAYNRRGSYVAVGYASGTVAVFDTMSRTVSGIYRKHHTGNPTLPTKIRKTDKESANAPGSLIANMSASHVASAPMSMSGDSSEMDIETPAKVKSSQGTSGSKSASSSLSPSMHRMIGNGVTSVSWSRRSRTLLVGAAGEALIRLIDTTHPSGAYECASSGNINPTTTNSSGVASASTPSITVPPPLSDAFDGSMPSPMHTPSAMRRDSMATTTSGAGMPHPSDMRSDTSFAETMTDISASMVPIDPTPRLISIKTIASRESTESSSNNQKKKERTDSSWTKVHYRERAPVLDFYLPQPIGSSLQVHPRHITAGIAALQDGSLVAFWVPHSAWILSHEDSETEQIEYQNEGFPTAPNPKKKSKTKKGPKVLMTTLFQDPNRPITCAAFCPHGEKIYAATQNGHLLGFEASAIFRQLRALAEPGADLDQSAVSVPKPSFDISIPGGAPAWHVMISRNGRSLVVNSSDAAIRLYHTETCWTAPDTIEKPVQVFQDVVQKLKFASCFLSGDGEHCVAGANGNSDFRYEWFAWSASTGFLLDKMSGPPNVELYSVTWHPTRSFVAVAASDGLVDVWGPRINWTAFAPDFQALPANVEYVEREDEFDIVVEDEEKKDGDVEDGGAAGEEKETKRKSSVYHDFDREYESSDEMAEVDILTVEPVPVFASDSEGEDDVFCFDTKIIRRRPTTSSGG